MFSGACLDGGTTARKPKRLEVHPKSYFHSKALSHKTRNFALDNNAASYLMFGLETEGVSSFESWIIG